MSVSSSSSIAGDFPGKTVMAEMPVILPPGASGSKAKQKHPQKRVDEFWKKFTTKTPGKATTILPKNELAERLAKRKSAKEASSSITAQASYEEAAARCRANVEQIIKECRRVNQKYRDPHFDLEVDLKTGRRDCLESLSNIKQDSSDVDSDSSLCSNRLRRRHRRRHPGPELNKGGGREPVAVAEDSINIKSGATAGGRTNEPGLAQNSPQGRTPGSKFSPKSVKRVGEIFDDPKFYIDGPTASDVRQGRDGDCWLMAALCTLSNKPGLIERICVAQNQDVGVYGFVFHRDGAWFSEIIDDKLYLTKPDYDEAMSEGFNMERVLWEDRERPDSEEAYRKTYQSNSGALYFAQCEDPNETWLPLLEKAYAKAHGDYASIEGGFTGEGIEDLTGGVTSGLFTTDILDKEYFWKEELMKVNQQFLFGCSTGLWGSGWGQRKGIMEGHAYSVMKAKEIDGERLVLLKNPWGKGEWTGAWSDGSKEWTPDWLQKLDHRFGDDGAFWISYKDLLRKYQAFDRTRLFGPDWKITSIWTTLWVPWTLEYHDTKFAFTLARAGPVVLVLSQLDDRYFRGLRGQYKFGLGIRVHKAGEDDYLVRAQTSYRMTRSVNVELELDAGEYTVVVKLDAQREDWIMPVEDVIRENAKDRREKLLRIGLSYDVAHSKAKIIESAEDKAARETYEKRKKLKQRERIRKMIQEEKERRHYQDVKNVNKQRNRIERRKERRRVAAEKKEAEAKKKEEERKEADEKERKETKEKARKGAEAKGKEEEEGSKAAETKKAADQEEGENKPANPTDGASQAGEDQKGPKEDSKPEVKEEAKEAEKEGDGPDIKIQMPISPNSPVGEDTPTSSASEETDKPVEEATESSPKTATDETDKTDTSNEQEPAPSDEKEQKSDSSVKQSSEPTEPETRKEESAETEDTKSVKAEQQEDEPEVKPKGGDDTAQSKPKPLPAETEEKIKRAIAVFADIKEELEEILGVSKAGDTKDDAQSRDDHDHRPDGNDHHDRRYHGYDRDRDRDCDRDRRSEYGYDRDRDHHHQDRDHDHPLPGYIPPQPPPPIGTPQDDRDDLSSVTTLSELSERELDFHVKDSNRQARMAMGQPPPPPGPPPHAHMPYPPEDEFESDPWNAVAVVGLRVYYKVVEGDKEREEEVVKLRVVRPNPYDVSDDEEGGKSEKEDGEGGSGDDEGDEEGGNADGEEEEEEKGMDESKVLDVDDSAKDASQVVS